MPETPRFMPTLLVKPKTMTRRDILRAEKLGGIVIVECEEPESARFVEPPAAIASLDAQARAAIFLLRWILQQPDATIHRGQMTKIFISGLLDGGQPDPTRAATPVKR